MDGVIWSSMVAKHSHGLFMNTVGLRDNQCLLPKSGYSRCGALMTAPAFQCRDINASKPLKIL